MGVYIKIIGVFLHLQMCMGHILIQIKKYLVEVVCSVTCVVASGDVMMDSGWKPLFLLTI